jgi:hypothetical protein
MEPRVSAAGRGTERIESDRYFTPRWAVHRFLEAYELPDGLWLEPCVGTGEIIRAVSEVRQNVSWLANDIHPVEPHVLTLVHSVTISDARTLVVPKMVKVVLTNPSFALAQEILEAMLLSKALVVFLQRINWAVGPRADLFRAQRPSVYVLPDRPSFCDLYDEEAPENLRAQTDATEYSWFAFDGRGDFKIIADTPSEVRKAEIAEGRANGTRPKKMKKPKRAGETA